MVYEWLHDNSLNNRSNFNDLSIIALIQEIASKIYNKDHITTNAGSTVKPRFNAWFGGAEKGAVNRGERLIRVSIIGITWHLVEHRLHSISAYMTPANSQIGLVRDLMSFVSLHDAKNVIWDLK